MLGEKGKWVKEHVDKIAPEVPQLQK